MIAGLPMYDLPGLEAHTDALWDAVGGRLRSAGVEAPSRLTRDRPLTALWTDPGLLLAQTCGYPLVKHLAGRVRVVATPRHLARGCRGARHCGLIVARRDDPRGGLAAFRGARCAVNDPESNTGMNLLRSEVAPLVDAPGGAFFRDVVLTGAHAASLGAVTDGDADLAAVDCVTYALLRRHRPASLGRLRVVALTARTPGLPLITATSTPSRVVQALREALSAVAEDPAMKPTLDALLIGGFTRLPASAYDAVLDAERQAAAHGYPTLQ